MWRSLLFAFFLASPALAARSEYAIDSEDWNSISTLITLAAGQGCAPIPSTYLDWSSLLASDALWVLYPRAHLDDRHLRRFVASGGRALLADDFGEAAPTLTALGIERVRLSSPPESGYFEERSFLPIAHRGLQTELGRATDKLVANHPMALRSKLPATFLFNPDAALVVEARIGRGQLVTLSDPSVLINNMLELDGNRAFAQELVAESCRTGGRIFLLTGSFTSSGEPIGREDKVFGSQIRSFLRQSEAALRGVMQDPSLASILAGLFAFLLGLVLIDAVPRAKPFDFHFATLADFDTAEERQKRAPLRMRAIDGHANA
jgi:hypothetical protein